MKKNRLSFSENTFKYFDSAQKNRKNKDWFEKHKDEYTAYVQEPFEELTELLYINFASELPKINFLPRRISRPVRRNPYEDVGVISTKATAYFSEKPTSQFEWNPGIYISIGHDPDDNVFGLGLYMVSSRQMNLLRNGIVEDFENIDAILSSKKLSQHWEILRGEVYKRFPRGYDEASEAAKYLRHKQFFLGQDLSPKQICQKNFFESVVKDIEVSLPFFCWVRDIVGVYRKQ